MSYEALLHQFVERDDRAVVMTAENRAMIRGLPEKIGERFIDVGICEQTMIGAAAGLALRGRIPVVHALASFLTMRAFEFIRTDVGIPGLAVKMVGSFAGLLSEANGPTHQAIEDIALMRGIPNVNVWCPADEQELLSGLDTVLQEPAPYYIRYNSMPPVVSHEPDFRPGVAEVVKTGGDVTLLSYGVLFAEAYRAAELLEDAGISVGVVNVRTLKPIDRGVILEAGRGSPLMVVIEDHFKVGGLYSIVAEVLLEGAVSTRVLSIAFDNRWFKPGLLADVLRYEKMTAAQIASTIQNEFSRL